MTEEDKAWLAELDVAVAGWSEHMRSFGIYVTVLRLHRLLHEVMELEANRVSALVDRVSHLLQENAELLQANNHEVEQRRAVEAAIWELCIQIAEDTDDCPPYETGAMRGAIVERLIKARRWEDIGR